MELHSPIVGIEGGGMVTTAKNSITRDLGQTVQESAL